MKWVKLDSLPKTSHFIELPIPKSKICFKSSYVKGIQATLTFNIFYVISNKSRNRNKMSTVDCNKR